MYDFSYCDTLGITDNEDNGWLLHFCDTAPEIVNPNNYTEEQLNTMADTCIIDGVSRTIKFHNNLKNKAWATPYFNILAAKGYVCT